MRVLTPSFRPFSHERGEHSDDGERGAAGDRAGPGRRLDAGAKGGRAEWLGGGLRADQLHREHVVRVDGRRRTQWRASKSNLWAVLSPWPGAEGTSFTTRQIMD